MFFCVHPYFGKWSNLTSIFFIWVDTTNYIVDDFRVIFSPSSSSFGPYEPHPGFRCGCLEQCTSRVVYLSHIRPINYSTGRWDFHRNPMYMMLFQLPTSGRCRGFFSAIKLSAARTFHFLLRNALLKQTPSLLSKSFAPVLQLMPSCFLVWKHRKRTTLVAGSKRRWFREWPVSYKGPRTPLISGWNNASY